MITEILWIVVAILFMVMLVFVGFVVYYQFQISKIRKITKEIDVVSATYYEILEALNEIKKAVNKIK